MSFGTLIWNQNIEKKEKSGWVNTVSLIACIKADIYNDINDSVNNRLDT